MTRKKFAREVFSSADHILFRLQSMRRSFITFPLELNDDTLEIEPEIINPYQAGLSSPEHLRPSIELLTHARPLTEEPSMQDEMTPPIQNPKKAHS